MKFIVSDHLMLIEKTRKRMTQLPMLPIGMSPSCGSLSICHAPVSQVRGSIDEPLSITISWACGL